MKEAGMPASDIGKAAVGITAWLLVGVLALIATEYWDPFWGALPVLAAVVAMWLIGERVLATDQEAQS
jgi:phosphatidylglycerophosphate synthase